MASTSQAELNGSPVQSYQTALSADAAGADLLTSAFVAAVTHYKRATVALPFPAEHFSPPTNSLEAKDFDAVLRAAEALPPLRSLLSDNANPSSDPSTSTTQGIPTSSHLLLGWLLAPTTRRPTSLRHISMQQLQTQLQRSKSDFCLEMSHHEAPTYIFENLHGSSAALSDPIIAFHGTSFERLHSIICSGLQPGSGTRLQRNGAIFGDGIYLSTNYSVAFSFCNPATTWRKSALGWKLRALLVCQVERSSATDVGTDKSLPPHYVLVQSPAAVKITHILVYCDQHSPPALPGSSSQADAKPRARRIDWCMVVVIMYGAVMVLQCLLQDRGVKRWLGLGR